MFFNDNYIKINYNTSYTTSINIQTDSGSTDGFIYSGIYEYDIDKNLIYDRYVTYVGGTLTKLTQDLKTGDTEVHLESTANFRTEEARYYEKGLISWDYKDSTGRLYEPETYSKNIYQGIFEYSNIDKQTGIIKLNAPWKYATISSGTQISQRSSTSTYNYILYCEENLKPNEWYKSGNKTIQGVSKGRYETFRYGSEYVRLHVYGVNFSKNPKINVSDLRFGETSKTNVETNIELTGHEPLRRIDENTSDYIEYLDKIIVRNIGVNSEGQLYKLENPVYENIELPQISTYEGNTIIEIENSGRIEILY